MIIKVLGSGCKKCVALQNNAQAAIEAAGIKAEVTKITDVVEIASYGIMSTPGLVIDDRVVSTGKILSAEQIAELLPAN